MRSRSKALRSSTSASWTLQRSVRCSRAYGLMRRRRRERGGLDDDGVELALPFHQAAEDAHEIAAHGAADAAVVHLEHFFIGADDEVVVDADLAELVDDHGITLAVILRQDAIEQR